MGANAGYERGRMQTGGCHGMSDAGKPHGTNGANAGYERGRMQDTNGGECRIRTGAKAGDEWGRMQGTNGGDECKGDQGFMMKAVGICM